MPKYHGTGQVGIERLATHDRAGHDGGRTEEPQQRRPRQALVGAGTAERRLAVGGVGGCELHREIPYLPSRGVGPRAAETVIELQ